MACDSYAGPGRSPSSVLDTLTGLLCSVIPSGDQFLKSSLFALLLEAEQILAAPCSPAGPGTCCHRQLLQEIHKKLTGAKGAGDRIEQAKDYVQSRVKRIMLASIEAI